MKLYTLFALVSIPLSNFLKYTKIINLSVDIYITLMVYYVN